MSTRAHRFVFTALLLAAFSSGCGDDSTPAGTDAAIDARIDGAIDAHIDAAVDSAATDGAIDGAISADAGPACGQPSDCPATGSACIVATCVNNVCGTSFRAAGTVVSNPVVGDCHSNRCDGNGNVTTNAVDDSDVPADDGNQCTGESCSGGTPSHPLASVGTACNQNGGALCDANGACVQCLAPSDCGADTACATRTCSGGTCGLSFAAAGTVVANPVAGDCHSNQCDGNGNLVTNAIDNSDVPVDGNQCTSDVCSGGVPSNPLLSVGTACNQNGGSLCDANGACVQCLSPSDCPASGNQCASASCSGGVCGTNNLPTGTACTSNGGVVCDGAGVCTNSVQVVRVGDGGAALSSVATALFLEERYVSNGALVATGHNPLALPTAVSGSNARLVVSGTATSEGALALSADGHYVTLAGYDADLGTAAVGTSASSTVNRIAGRVDASGNIDTSTRINALISGNAVRSAVTDDGTRFWVGGATSGAVFIALGTTGGTSILASPSNVRWLEIFGGQLYGSSGSGTFVNVFTIGTGLPTTTGQTATSLPGMPTTGASPYAYSFVGTGVLYVADDRAIASGGGVQKWTLNGSTWTLTTTFNSGITAGARGVTAFVTGSTTTVVATVATTSANTLVVFVDDGVNLNPTATVISTAATNTVYRGVAPSPR